MLIYQSDPSNERVLKCPILEKQVAPIVFIKNIELLFDYISRIQKEAREDDADGLMNKSDTNVREMSFRTMKNDLYVQANDNNEDYFALS